MHSRVEPLCILASSMSNVLISNSNSFQCTLNVHRIILRINCNWEKIKNASKSVWRTNKRSVNSLVQEFNHPETRLLNLCIRIILR